MFLLLLFALGASIGSFLNVCIWRLPRGESVVQPPSHCPHCNTRLRALDLMPLLSQLFLRGKCRYCGAHFSWRYFNIELLTGVLFVLVGLWAGPVRLDAQTGAWSGDFASLLQGVLFVSTLVVIFWVDYDTRLIQLESALLLGLTGVLADAWRVWREGASLVSSVLPFGMLALPAALPGSLLAMLLVAGLLWAFRGVMGLLYGREVMGFGDVILVGGIAAHLGWNATLFTFAFLSVVVGAVVGIGLKTPRAVTAYRWAKRRGKGEIAGALARHAYRKGIPFGPMLAAGGVAALLYGAHLNTAYLNWVGVNSAPSATPGASPASTSSNFAPPPP